MRMRLEHAFFERDALDVAPELVGKWLCRKTKDGRVLSCRITETEIYRGSEDLACHARFGRTKRTETMYQTGGFAYIYLVYGLHHLFNVVTGAPGQPQAVLIRAMEKPLNGPGKWTKAMHITVADNGLYLPKSHEIWLEDDGASPFLKTAPRVGIDYAGEPWKSIPWRFIADE